ncbi:MAG: methylmalonyl Co-A mutase-associated GTPase MeaB, partial [Nitrospirales bacterium]|nr:methylmalonyl Co-A mutase-associated GTPase MeaB [Nitrospirales bacterium]
MSGLSRWDRRSVFTNSVLGERVNAGDIQAISRLITLLESEHPQGRTVLNSLTPHGGHVPIVGITGYPGAGKSTLIDQLTKVYRTQGKKVGILAVDMSSPVTGGAILGDRIRMQSHWGDEQVYIRSLATRGHRGGLAKVTGEVVRVLEAAGYDIILVETVGVGQEEGDIIKLAQTVVVVVAPNLGDEVQAMKAGLLEVAHLVVVNKADQPGAEHTVSELHDWVADVVSTVAV